VTRGSYLAQGKSENDSDVKEALGQLPRSTYDQLIDEELIRQLTSRLGVKASQEEISEEVHARHILFQVKTEDASNEAKWSEALAKAQFALEELKKGTDFAELAKKYSEDPNSKDKGGDLGFFARTQMVPEFDQVAFTLKNGEVSEPVRTQYGYHLIQVLERRPLKSDPNITSMEKDGISYDTFAGILVTNLLKQRLVAMKQAEVTSPALQVHLAQIVYKFDPNQAGSASAARKKADDALVKLKAGANFAQLVQDESQDDESKQKGGDMGWIPRGLKEPAVDEAAFKLNPGEYSDVVQLSSSYVVFQCLEKDPARPIPYDQLTQLKQNVYQRWFDEEKSKARIWKEPGFYAGLAAGSGGGGQSLGQ